MHAAVALLGNFTTKNFHFSIEIFHFSIEIFLLKFSSTEIFLLKFFSTEIFLLNFSTDQAWSRLRLDDELDDEVELLRSTPGFGGGTAPGFQPSSVTK